MNDIEKSSKEQFNQWATWFDMSFSHWQFSMSNGDALKVLHPKKNSSILDVGCGTGILLEQADALNRNIKLYGIDISDGMIEKAKIKFGNRAALRVGSANKLPYKDNTFDYVVCCTSLHHHPNTKKSLSEMYRVVKKRGTVLVLDVFVDGLLRTLSYRLDNMIFKEGKTFAYTRKQMYQLFKDAGFQNISQQTQAYFKLITKGIK